MPVLLRSAFLPSSSVFSIDSFNTMDEKQKTICVRCSAPITAEESYTICQGFCSDAYHASCVKLTQDDVASFRRNHCIWWMCVKCGNMMRELRNDDSLISKRSKCTSKPIEPKLTTVQKKSLSEEIVELKEQITSIHQSIADLSVVRKEVQVSLEKDAPLAQSSPMSFSRLMHGSNHSNRSDSSVVQDKFWLFFTRIKNTVNEERILKMVANCIGSKDAVVKKLVSKRINVATLPFISFKVGIDTELKDVALNPASWPEGVCFREFHDSYKLWEP